MLNLNLPPYCHIPLSYIMSFISTLFTKKFKPHACTHHVDIIAMLTLCYSIMSYATLILYHHISMLTLQTSLILCAFWLPQA